MAIVVEQKSSGNFTPMQEGLHLATVTEVKDLGEITNAFGTKRCIVARFVAEDGSEASRFYTPSLHEKSTLFKDLKAIFGEVPKSFDIEKLVGTKAQILVTNFEKDGKTKAKIEKVLKAPGAKKKVTPAENVHGVDISDKDLGF